MTETVVDASVAVQLMFEEIQSEHASALVADVVADGGRLVAPVLLPIEITNVIRKRSRSDGFSIRAAVGILDTYFSYPILLMTPPRIHHRALEIAVQLGIGGHDAHYLALAEMLHADFWTDDQRLIRATTGNMVNVRWIGDYPMPN